MLQRFGGAAGRTQSGTRPGIDRAKGETMGINTERDVEANLQIGPTDHGMVRLFISAGELEVPMDFEPEEAEEIAEEIRAAAAAARRMKARR